MLFPPLRLQRPLYLRPDPQWLNIAAPLLCHAHGRDVSLVDQLENNFLFMTVFREIPYVKALRLKAHLKLFNYNKV